MINWNTYFTTRDRDFGPIIKHVDPINASPNSGGGRYYNDGAKISPGAQIGRIINAMLLFGLLLYFCLIR